MAEPVPSAGTKLKDNHVPFEKSESQNVSWKPWAWRTIKFALVTKAAGLAGFFAGKAMGQPTVKFGFMRYNNATQWGAAMGGIYETYQLWRETTGKRKRVETITADLYDAINPEHTKKEIAKEQAVIDDLHKLEKALSERNTSHRNNVTTRREAAHSLERD